MFNNDEEYGSQIGENDPDGCAGDYEEDEEGIYCGGGPNGMQ